MVKFEFNKKKLEMVSNSLSLVGNNMNVEIYNLKASLKLLDTLNLTSGGAGLMDLQIEEKKSLVKFLESQQELIQKLIILTKQS